MKKGFYYFSGTFTLKICMEIRSKIKTKFADFAANFERECTISETFH